MNTERIVAGLVERIERRYFGKYRGFVVDNDDQQHLGRLRLRVPSVFGPRVVTGWAMPCVPYGGAAGQGLLFVPDRDAGVWVEFEEGDLEFPIWVGTFWSAPNGQSEIPVPNAADGSSVAAPQSPPSRKIIKTAKGHTLQFEDADDGAGITVYDGVNGHVIVLDADGITIEDGAHPGNRIVLSDAGVTVQDSHGSAITTSSSGIQLGKGAIEAVVLGTTFAQNLATLLNVLQTHVHAPVGGVPASGVPVTAAAMVLSVPLSGTVTVK